MARTHVLGFPRVGARRELKFALESYWRGESDEAHLLGVGRELRARHWALQRAAGLDTVVAGDFAYYDQMLNMSVLLGALPQRFGFDGATLTLAQYFELARGNASEPAMEMTKWFDTNYHFLVPEVDEDSTFGAGQEWFFDEVDEALDLGHRVKPVLIGPLTFLFLAKTHTKGFERLSLLPTLIARYAAILARLASRGIEWVQIDEPILCMDLEPAWLDGFGCAYASLAAQGVKLMLTTYFESSAHHIEVMAALPVHGIHIDLVRAPQQLDAWRVVLGSERVLSVGIIDARNVWRADLRAILDVLEPLQRQLDDRLWIAPSSSLLHVPVALDDDFRLFDELKSWLAFAHEKVLEISVLGRALSSGRAALASELALSDASQASRRSAKQIVNPTVRRATAAVSEAMGRRASPFSVRALIQREALKLPGLPTTTIGSFPQTAAIRQARAAYKRGDLSALDYLERMRAEIETAVRRQEALGLDVLVHGEAERNDMVEYFGEQLWGYAFSDNGWVQSYGSRCVKPPIIYGDVYRPQAISVETTRFAQSLTARPMKGMLTGPITMLQWSFVRDDQPRALTALQLALAIRAEVCDLESAGIRIIQIDEPALREGLPLRKSGWSDYLQWAVQAFRIAAGAVSDSTQIHTHMCYAEFNDILPAIAAMDADVITIETSRSQMELLEGFGEFHYPNDIGPGVYDIHSPRIPSVNAILTLLRRATQVIPVERLWVNPDCGLKTRGWAETETALAHMVEAAHSLRTEMGLAGHESGAKSTLPSTAR
jgi:5-methyltetrahydropteroyltriglutamate--homocysteine methyltransferase